jgi:[NiFe] hydrogenase diaphorase moiety large subunit
VSAQINSDNFVTDLLTANNQDPGRLLQCLHAIQYRYSYIPKHAIDQLASAMQLTQAHIEGVVGFYAFLHTTPRGQFDILFSDNITDYMLGSRELMRWLCDRLGVEPGVPRSDGRVTVDATPCTGMCDQGVSILVNGITVTQVDDRRVVIIADLVEKNVPVAHWPAEFFTVQDHIFRRDRMLFSDTGKGEALHALHEKGADGMLDDIEKSGLRGRGGAGFFTALKWRFCKQAEADAHYVICNADEGEPGTFKDRVLLTSHSNCVFEGMTLCAGIIGAKQGYLYLRGEYLYLREQLEQILAQRREKGLLGKNILGRDGFDFDIEIHIGAGAYICGEESALIESLEGKRGIPRIRPPFPVTHGYRNKPTVVNNVETFTAAAKIASLGVDWFRDMGTTQSTGTRLLSVSGDCARPGIYEYPFGITVQQVLDDCGATDTQAVQMAGAAGSMIPPQDFGRAIAFEDVATGGSFMIFNQQRDLYEMVLNFARFFVHESCGFCTPCRVGGSLLKDLVEKLYHCRASRYDVEQMKNIGALMQRSSHCGLGTTAPNPVLDLLNHFPGLVEQHLSHDSYEPAFDVDASLQQARQITGRDDEGAHIR